MGEIVWLLCGVLYFSGAATMLHVRMLAVIAVPKPVQNHVTILRANIYVLAFCWPYFAMTETHKTLRFAARGI